MEPAQIVKNTQENKMMANSVDQTIVMKDKDC